MITFWIIVDWKRLFHISYHWSLRGKIHPKIVNNHNGKIQYGGTRALFLISN